jgi:hypothetical protein
MLCDGSSVAQFSRRWGKSGHGFSRISTDKTDDSGRCHPRTFSLLPAGGSDFFLKQRYSVLRRCLRPDGRDWVSKSAETWSTRLVCLGLDGATRPCSKLVPYKAGYL